MGETFGRVRWYNSISSSIVIPVAIYLSSPLRPVLPGAAGPCFSVTPWVLPNDTFCDMSLEPSKLFLIQKCISGFPLHLIIYFVPFLFSLFYSFPLELTCRPSQLAVFPDKLLFFLKAYLCFGLLTDAETSWP